MGSRFQNADASVILTQYLCVNLITEGGGVVYNQQTFVNVICKIK